MPTKKRAKGTRSGARRGAARAAGSARRPKRSAAARTKPSARAKAASRKKPAAPKRAARRAAPRSTKGRAATTRVTRPTSAATSQAAASVTRELAALKTRFQREKSAFERRLTETVREIGQLRHHEARAMQLERQLKERDDTIAQLRTQLNDLRNRELAPAEDEEVQPSLALGPRAAHDLDEFDDDVAAEDDDELI